MILRRLALILVLTFVYAADGRAAAGVRYVELPLRGRTLTLALYVPPTPAIGTVVMASGDVGWVGLGAAMAEFLSTRGYVVAGINSRQYLTTFAAGKTHLAVTDPPADYREVLDWLSRERLLTRPVVLSGVSEGAAIAVLAAADEQNHTAIDGVITMGLPAVAELAWSWKDIGAWITKTDAKEPSFRSCDFVAAIAPAPLAMLQSTHDEYVPARDYDACFASARDPKKLVLIDARNHRFTDKRAELAQAFLGAIDWIRDVNKFPR